MNTSSTEHLFSQLRGGLIVSCQAKTGSPLRDSGIMAIMARAAIKGGAVGIRADGPQDIAAIRAAVTQPIIGIFKQQVPGWEVYITPTLESARQVVSAGADLVALDATHRSRPGDVPYNTLIRAIKDELGVPVMADIATLEEGIAADQAGADLVATTLVGYTAYSQPSRLPDFDLIAALVRSVKAPVVVEGHVITPDDACRALDLGAFAVVVGAAITQPDWITQNFVSAMHSIQEP